MAVNVVCPVCQGTRFSEGELPTYSFAKLRHFVRSSFLKSKSYGIRSLMCVNCGRIQLFGDFGQDLDFVAADK